MPGEVRLRCERRVPATSYLEVEDFDAFSPLDVDVGFDALSELLEDSLLADELLDAELSDEVLSDDELPDVALSDVVPFEDALVAAVDFFLEPRASFL